MPRAVIAAAVALCVVTATFAWTAPAGWGDANSPDCPTPGIDSGTLTPGMPGGLVNAGTPAVTVAAQTTAACGWAANSTLRLWSPDPSWFQAATSAKLGTTPADASAVKVTKVESAGSTETTFAATVPTSGETWVGVRYRIPDHASALGFGVNQSALLPTRLVVRTPPKINPPPPVVAHDNKNTPLSGTAWPGDTVNVNDSDGNLLCGTVARADGSWACAVRESFPRGVTSFKVSQHGTGANNPRYPGLSSTNLADLDGNTVKTAVVMADPAVLKELSNATPRVGEVVSYTITALNNGPDTAVNVSVADALPEGMVYVSSTATAGTFDADAGRWTGIGNLARNQRQKLTIRARVTKRGTITNPARVSATAATDGVNTSRLIGAGGVPDWNTNLANDVDRAVLTTAPSADPQLTKTVDRRVHRLGDIAVYTLTATNNGPDPATGVSVHDPLPAGLVFVSATPSVGTYDKETNRWLIGNLRTTDTFTLLLRARIVGSGVIRNVATISTSATSSDRSRASDANTKLTNDVDAAVVEVPNAAAVAWPWRSPGW